MARMTRAEAQGYAIGQLLDCLTADRDDLNGLARPDAVMWSQILSALEGGPG